MAFCEFLRDRRRQLGLTVAQAATRAGLSYWSWYEAERRVPRRPPTLEVAAGIATALGCTAADIYRHFGI